MFKYMAGGKSLDLALVLPMDAPIGMHRTVDRDLRFTRLRARPSASSEFITLHAVIRGALLVPDFERDGDFFLVDLVDPDMFLRARRQQLL
jgi:hypothetical protein